MKRKKAKTTDWVWHGHPLHFCCGTRCNFRLGTTVGEYVISTVGELWYDREQLKTRKWEEISCDNFYETMVFNKCGNLSCGCPKIDGHELECLSADDPKEANKNHLAMCNKYAKLQN